MKNFLAIATIFILFVLQACENDRSSLPTSIINNPKSANGSTSKAISTISFIHDEHDFGRLIQGERVSFVFKFKNIGTADLLISKVSASCGCTASKYTTEPVKPGGEGRIEVSFDSNGQKGIQNKTITVLTNGQPQSVVLRVKAQVIAPASF